MNRHRHGGFTLTELLIVAVLGLLAALPFPGFAQAREQGRQACCITVVC